MIWARGGCSSRVATCPAPPPSTCCTTATSFVELEAPRRDTAHTHGTGDTLAAAVTAALARRASMPEAVRFGKAFVTAAVGDSFPLGFGLGPVGHFWRIRRIREDGP